MDQKKLAIIGSNHRAALELTYQGLIEKVGYSVSLFPAQSIFLEYYNRSVFNKLLYRVGLSLIINQIQDKLKEFIISEKPSIILVFKGMEITPETLLWMKNQGITMCNYNPDHPFIFSGRGSGNRNVTHSITLYDYYFSYAEDAVEQLNKLGVKSYKIPFGFDNESFNYQELKLESEIPKVCFLGNADKQRVHFINQLAKLGLDIDVFGENWHQFTLEPLVRVGPAKYGQEFWLILQTYAVQLNLLRPHNTNSHNMRSFDIPGAGGILLAPFTVDHAMFYNDGEEVFLFHGVEQAAKMANELMCKSFEQRQEIRKKARQKSVEVHTYKQRVQELLKVIED